MNPIYILRIYAVELRKIRILFFIAFATIAARAAIPSPSIPPRLVNDYASMLTATEAQQLEDILVAYDDSTSTQICIVTVNSLDGQDILQVAYEIGEKWGVGQKDFSNGVVLLIKNKTASIGGEMAIATGYGVEGSLTDALCRRIIDNDMVPYFRNEEYFQGIMQAVLHIQRILSGEFHKDADEEKYTILDWLSSLPYDAIIPIIIFILLIIYSRKHPEKFNDNSSNDDFWDGSGNGPSQFGGFDTHHHGRHSSGTNIGGDFSHGGHSRSGGFGGFGGGHFGGGGARGGW